MKKGVWFGLIMMAIVVGLLFYMMPSPDKMTLGHLGLLMLGLIVVMIMLGFPTAFTLMGMGTMFTWFAYYSADPSTAVARTLDLMVQRAYWVMNNDVLISVPLFVFMGYLVERANLIERLFHSLHLATCRIPGALAVATVVTCAIFACASGIIGAVVTLMGLLAFPAMLKAGYGIRLSAGAVTAGGTLGILIPPSVLLILYGATAGVSVMQLYAGAFFPGLMLAGLYLGGIILYAKLFPHNAPPLSEEDKRVELPEWAEVLSKRGSNALAGLTKAAFGNGDHGIPRRTLFKNLGMALLPALSAVMIMGPTYFAVTKPQEAVTGVQEMGMAAEPGAESADTAQAPSTETEPDYYGGGLEEPPGAAEAETAGGLQEPPGTPEAESAGGLQEPPGTVAEAPAPAAEEAKPAREPAPMAYWYVLGFAVVSLAIFYLIFDFSRLEVFRLLLTSFFPLALLILGVLGSIIAGLATPTEAAAMGSFGGLALAVAYGQFSMKMLKESVILTARTSAMVCWLFIGSGIFAAGFALLGGQEIVNNWVTGLDLSPVQFMLLAQIIIFLLGWPLEWTEIIIIFMPIFLPLLTHFSIDPLFFGLLVALNLQTAFLSPPVAMAAFYLKGVAPPHVTLNQIFLGMIPFMIMQILAIFLLYMFPQIGLWLPSIVYGG
ncbi:MAG: TRAP transporter large permease subunit [Thermodesulfobacteriota bacterium]